MTEKDKLALLESVHMIGILNEVVQIEYQCLLVDHKFKMPALNNHAKKIKDSSNAIKTSLNTNFNNKDPESMTYTYAIQMHRLIAYFMAMDIERVEEFMDGVEDL